ncbi:protein Hook homolog 3 [Lepeophtheirus salmonis]|uniref:protein Hook homolog 3 n=1 Tax=Lepeophtheirus salmonis TaxID=72036 RepID=UPI003AF3CE36
MSILDSSLTPSLNAWLSVQGYSQYPTSLAQFLNHVDPTHFNEIWRNKIKCNAEDNVRMKTLNYKRLLDGINEYYSEKIAISIADFSMPDPQRVADDAPDDVGRLLQLVLGCAINCESKHTYIAVIMEMEESVQRVIMQAIQELMALPTLSTLSAFSTSSSVAIDPLMFKKTRGRITRGKVGEGRAPSEYSYIGKQNLLLLLLLDRTTVSRMLRIIPPIDGNGIRIQELRRQVEGLQEDLVNLESSRDEYQVKVEVLEKQLEDASIKETELQKLADQAQKFKDEVDILREYSEKAAKYETSIESYKKKMEEMSDLKRQVKLLEDKNIQYMQKNLDLEEEIKKTGSWKPQVDVYKKKIVELQTKLDSETKRSDKLDFESKKLLEKVESLSLERDRLLTERDQLKECNIDLSDEIKMSNYTTRSGGLGDNLLDEPESAILENIPSNVKERILKLQRENRKLKTRLQGGEGASPDGSASSTSILQTMVEDLKDREVELQSLNRKANQRILELESRVEDMKESVPRVIPGSREELELKLSESSKVINILNSSLQKKEAEISAMEERYKKYIEKAKAVIKTLDPSKGVAGSGEVTALRSQLQDKDKLIDDLEQDSEKSKAVKEMEEKLMASAFYSLSMQLHRSALDNRINVSSPSAQQTSFLNRQRQVPPANTATTPKSRVQGGEYTDY